MKEILELIVSQIRVYPMDVIGFSSLKRHSSIDQIRDRYSFEIVPQVPEGFPIEAKAIGFRNGEFEYNKKKYLISNTQIEERRILITVSANSNVAVAYYDDLIEMLTSLDLRSPIPEYVPLLAAQETTIIVKLDFSMRNIFESSLIGSFDNLLKKKMQEENTHLLVYPNSIKFKFKYLDIPNKLKKNRISLSDKEFILEVRERTDPEDQIFFSFSPTDSETHLSILLELEKLIVGSGK